MDFCPFVRLRWSNYLLLYLIIIFNECICSKEKEVIFTQHTTELCGTVPKAQSQAFQNETREFTVTVITA